jgi:hypothetical protein
MNVLRIGRVLPGVALLCLFTSCGSNSSYEKTADMSSAKADTVSYAYDPKTSKIPEDKLMVRTAAMNFKVEKLQKTSQKIAAITANCGGEIWNSHLQTEVQNTITTKVSADSLMEVITYRQTNEMTIRVPSKNLDSLLVRLEDLSELLHNKEVTTENVSFDYLSNELKSKNMARTQERYEDAIDTKKSNLEKYTNAEYSNIEMQNNVIDRQIENLALLDKVNYSTVKISIYQDTQAYKNIVANLHSDQFEPPFGASVLMAVQDGWNFMLGALVFFIRIWPLYIFLIAVFFLIRYLEKLKVKFSK